MGYTRICLSISLGSWWLPISFGVLMVPIQHDNQWRHDIHYFATWLCKKWRFPQIGVPPNHPSQTIFGFSIVTHGMGDPLVSEISIWQTTKVSGPTWSRSDSGCGTPGPQSTDHWMLLGCCAQKGRTDEVGVGNQLSIFLGILNISRTCDCMLDIVSQELGDVQVDHVPTYVNAWSTCMVISVNGNPTKHHWFVWK